MRRIALLAGMAALGLLPAPGAADELYDTCRETDAALLLQGPCRGAEKLLSAGAAHCRYVTGNDEACAVPLTRKVIRREIDEHERSRLHDALTFQYHLGDDLPFTNAPWAGTHNSFNSVKRNSPALSEIDANQQLSLTDQLRLDMRSLEIDLHSFRGRPRACHAQGQGIGCSRERPFRLVAEELGAWLDAHPDQVLLLYLEDHLSPRHEEQVRYLLHKHMDVLTTEGRSFATLTRDAVRAAGAQVVVVGGRGETWAWRSVAFDWAPHEWEARPHGFANCANAGEPPPPYATDLVRFYEDSTWLTSQAELAGQSRTDDGLRVETVRAMVRCGVDLFGFDQLVPDDERLPALVWSWAPYEDAGADCAVRRAGDGRWLASACDGTYRAACRTPDGTWTTTAAAITRAAAPAACEEAGATFTAPRTGAENAAIPATSRVWVGI